MANRVVRNRTLILPALFVFLSCSAGAQNSSLDGLLDSLGGGTNIRQVAISPDGQRVAWVETGGASPHGIFVCTLASPESTKRRVTASSADDASDEHGIAWSPDSLQLAFVSNAQTPDQLQLYVAKVAGGEARKLLRQIQPTEPN